MGLTNNLGKLSNMITSTGSAVGIAQASPAYTLDVSGTGRFTSTLLVSGAATFSSSVTAGGYITGQGTNPGGLGGSRYVLDWLSGSMRIFSYGADASTNGGFVFNSQRSDGTNSFNSMTITSAGNVGIGTSTPSYLLDINGMARILRNGGDEALRISNDNGYIGFFNTANSTRSAYIQGNTTSLQISSSLAIPIQFLTSDAERMRITSGGLVGIGTVSPLGTGGTEQTLHLSSGAANYTTLYVTNGANSVKAIVATQSSEGVGIFGMQSNHPALFVTNDTKRMTITSGGVVQIAGLTSNGTVSTQSSNGSLYVSSDANLKIEDGFVENGLEKVLALKPRYFYWKDTKEFSADRQLGFYAQEVNAVSEETANTPPEGCGWGIYDRGLVALLTSAIQEMNTKFEEQNQTIQNLQEQNQDLKSRLDKAGL